MKPRRLLIFYAISALLSSIFVMANSHIVLGYGYIGLLPMLFFIGILFIFVLDRPEKKGRLTVYIFVSIQWLRTVLQPLLGSISGYFEDYGTYVQEKYAGFSVALMIYETAITFLFVILFYRFSGNRNPSVFHESKLRGNTAIYGIFIAFAGVLFFVTGADTYQFFALSTASGRLSTTLGNEGSGSDALINYGLTFLVILIIHNCSVQYQRTEKKRYVYYAMLCAALRLCLISSESRLAQVYILGAFLLILPQLFPQHKTQIVRSVGAVAVLVLGFMTIYKVFYAFNYDSYMEAIRASSFGLSDLADQLDIYFYGVKTIARNTTYCMQSDLGASQLVMDFLRNIFGIHYLLPDAITTVNDYNFYIYHGQQASGYLFSSLAYGYLFFGAILAPLCTCFNFALSFWIEKLLDRIQYTDIYYIACLVYMRCAVMIFANFPQTFNYITRTVVLGVLVIGGSSIFSKRSGNKNKTKNFIKQNDV